MKASKLLASLCAVPILLAACHTCNKPVEINRDVQSLMYVSTGGYADQSLSVEYRDLTATRIVLRGPSGELVVEQPQKEALQLARQLARIDYRSLASAVPTLSDGSARVDSPTIEIVARGHGWKHKITRKQRSGQRLERTFNQALDVFHQLIVLTATMPEHASKGPKR